MPSCCLRAPERQTQALIDEVYREALEKRAGKAYASWARSEVTWHGSCTETESRLHALAVPTLLIQGAQNKLVPVNFARRAHALIAQSQLATLPGCGHWVKRDDPQAFRQVVEPFLETRRKRCEYASVPWPVSPCAKMHTPSPEVAQQIACVDGPTSKH